MTESLATLTVTWKIENTPNYLNDLRRFSGRELKNCCLVVLTTIKCKRREKLKKELLNI